MPTCIGCRYAASVGRRRRPSIQRQQLILDLNGHQQLSVHDIHGDVGELSVPAIGNPL